MSLQSRVSDEYQYLYTAKASDIEYRNLMLFPQLMVYNIFIFIIYRLNIFFNHFCRDMSRQQYCRKCYQKGARKIQGLFTCAKCGEENADRNAAFNIAYRALGYISKVGVTVDMPKLKLTFASVERNAKMTKEATYFNRW